MVWGSALLSLHLGRLGGSCIGWRWNSATQVLALSLHTQVLRAVNRTADGRPYLVVGQKVQQEMFALVSLGSLTHQQLVQPEEVVVILLLTN